MVRIINFLIKIIRLLGGRHLIKLINIFVRKIAAFTHFVQYILEWGAKPVPGWFDHNINLYYNWYKTKNPLSWERGIFSLLAVKENANVLELCCGGGFNSYYFYSIRAGKVTALDLDKEAITSAQRNYKAKNLIYLVADIRNQIPIEKYDNIIFDASLEYFSEYEIVELMKTIKSRLALNGILSGYSTITQQVLHSEWKYIFKQKEDLLIFLQPYFKNVRVFETKYPSRHNLYFFASDGQLPFDEKWALQTVCRQN